MSISILPVGTKEGNIDNIDVYNLYSASCFKHFTCIVFDPGNNLMQISYYLQLQERQLRLKEVK